MRPATHGTPGFWGAPERAPRVSARARQTCLNTRSRCRAPRPPVPEGCGVRTWGARHPCSVQTQTSVPALVGGGGEGEVPESCVLTPGLKNGPQTFFQ